MEPLRLHRGIGIPLRRQNIDTDQIVPSKFLKRTSRTGYDDALFAEWRKDREFILNREPYTKGSIIVAGPNFGIGSSREHAVWALRDYGVRAVLAPSFGDIFRANAGFQGLLAGVISPADAERLWTALEADPGVTMTVDLERCVAEVDGVVRVPFTVAPHVREALMSGHDAIDLSLHEEDAISAYERSRAEWLPTTLPSRHEVDAVVRPARTRS